jgi:hypothetical protein
MNNVPIVETPTVYVGDSYSQGKNSPGALLEARLGGPSKIRRYAMVGASSADFEKDEVCQPTGCRADYSLPGQVEGLAGAPLKEKFPGLSKLLDSKPSNVIIALGTNDALSYCSGGLGMPEKARKLAALAKGSSCVWIGPISFPKGTLIGNACGPEQYNEYVKLLIEAVTQAGCKFVDMRRAGDTSRGCPADNPDYLEPSPEKNCSLQPSDSKKLHFRSGDPQIAIWAKYVEQILAGKNDQPAVNSDP